MLVLNQFMDAGSKWRLHRQLDPGLLLPSSGDIYCFA